MHVKSFLISVCLLLAGQALLGMQYEHLDNVGSELRSLREENVQESPGVPFQSYLCLSLCRIEEQEYERVCCFFPWKRNEKVFNLLSCIESEVDKTGLSFMSRENLGDYRYDLQRSRDLAALKRIALGGCCGLAGGVGAESGFAAVLAFAACGMCVGCCASCNRTKNPMLERVLAATPEQNVMSYDGAPATSK